MRLRIRHWKNSTQCSPRNWEERCTCFLGWFADPCKTGTYIPHMRSLRKVMHAVLLVLMRGSNSTGTSRGCSGSRRFVASSGASASQDRLQRLSCFRWSLCPKWCCYGNLCAAPMSNMRRLSDVLDSFDVTSNSESEPVNRFMGTFWPKIDLSSLGIVTAASNMWRSVWAY